MNNSLFSCFMPKETEFFPLLGQLSDIIINSSELLVNCLSSSNYDEALVFAKKIKEQEIKADMLTQQIFDSLNTTFITPFDREDIHDLADKLESVIDGINSSAKKIVLYYPDKYPTGALELAKLLKEASIQIKSAVNLLGKMQKNILDISTACDKLNELEHIADGVYEEFITSLFKNEENVKEIVKLRDILSELENSINLTERVGKSIRTIIIKYA